MKLVDITEGGSGSGRQPAEKRPNKNLWFQRQDLWMEDLHQQYGINMDMLTTNDEHESDYFVVDAETQKTCYGVWRKDLKQGVSFYKPQPLNMIGDPRTKYVRIVDAPIPG